MRRGMAVVVGCLVSLVAIEACVGDDPVAVANSGADSGGGADGSTQDDGASTTTDGGGADADAGFVPIDVTGITADDDMIAPNVSITIRDARGQEKPATSGADGKFAVTDVLPPYDIHCINGPSHTLYSQLVTSYVVLPQTTAVNQPMQDDVSSGTDGGTPAQTITSASSTILMLATRKSLLPGVVQGFSPDVPAVGQPWSTANCSYSIVTPTPSFKSDVHVFRMTMGSNPTTVPISYEGYGVVEDAVFPAASTPSIGHFSFVDPGENYFSGGGFSVPAGLQSIGRFAYLTKGPRTSLLFLDDRQANGSTSFSVIVPMIAGYAVSLCGEAQGAVGLDAARSSGCKANAGSGAALSLLAVPVPTAPAGGEVGVSRSGPFTFTQADPKQRYRVTLRPKVYDPSGIVWTVYTTQKTVALPSWVPPLGANTDYNLVIESTAPFDKLDDSLTEDEALHPHDKDRYETRSATISFKTTL